MLSGTMRSPLPSSPPSLFDEEEIRFILDLGRCPVLLEPAMRDLIRICCTAARSDWINKMRNNQDDETIALYQMLAVFDPLQKAAFNFTVDELLVVFRPVHDSIYEPQAGYDPLKVLSVSFHHSLSASRLSLSPFLRRSLMSTSEPTLASYRTRCGTSGWLAVASNHILLPQSSLSSRFLSALLTWSAPSAK